MITRNINNIGQPLVDSEGVIYQNTKVSFTLVWRNKPHQAFDSITNECIVPVPVVVYTDVNGEFSIDLWCTSRTEDPDFYYVCDFNDRRLPSYKSKLPEDSVPLDWETFKATGKQL